MYNYQRRLGTQFQTSTGNLKEDVKNSYFLDMRMDKGADRTQLFMIFLQQHAPCTVDKKRINEILEKKMMPKFKNNKNISKLDIF